MIIQVNQLEGPRRKEQLIPPGDIKESLREEAKIRLGLKYYLELYLVKTKKKRMKEKRILG